jgi:hypothetical protein
MTKSELIDAYAELGLNSEFWLKDENITLGLAELAKHLFVKECWNNIVPDKDTRWIDRSIASTPEGANNPYDGSAHSLRRLLACGASKDDINEVVRCAQAELLFSVLYQLDDSGIIEENDNYVSWNLTIVDEEQNPITTLGCLHEYVLSYDPSGREMRPRPLE